MLNKLLNERKQRFLKESIKYLRLMFNDHFTILLLFILGAGGFLYRELLVLVAPEMIGLKLLISGILVFIINLATIPTYLEEADVLFLMPKIYQIKNSYHKFATHLMVLKSMILVCIMMMLSPLLNVLSRYNRLDLFMFIVQVILWQGLYIFIEKTQTLYDTDSKQGYIKWLFNILSITVIFFSLSYSSLIGLLLTVGIMILSIVLLNSSKGNNQISVEQLIEVEQNRKSAIYKLFSLVTDVPQLTQRSFRSRLVTPLIGLMFPHHNNRVDYLLPRLFFRQGIFVKLYMRLIILGSIFIGMSGHQYIVWAFAIGFHFIILFQILPLLDNMNRRVQVKLKPFTKKQSVKGIERLLIRLSIIIIIIFAGVSLFNGWRTTVVLILLNSIMTGLFVKLYLPNKLRLNK